MHAVATLVGGSDMCNRNALLTFLHHHKMTAVRSSSDDQSLKQQAQDKVKRQNKKKIPIKHNFIQWYHSNHRATDLDLDMTFLDRVSCSMMEL